MENEMKKYYLSLRVSTRKEFYRFSEMEFDIRTQTCPTSLPDAWQAGLRPIHGDYFLSNISFGTSAFSGHPSGIN
jgi:hypothetical protein